jgi:hypothetical protein
METSTDKIFVFIGIAVIAGFTAGIGYGVAKRFFTKPEQSIKDEVSNFGGSYISAKKEAMPYKVTRTGKTYQPYGKA